MAKRLNEEEVFIRKYLKLADATLKSSPNSRQKKKAA
jgi:hypothetical protein